MRKLLCLICFLAIGTTFAQIPDAKLTPNGFEPVSAGMPAIKSEKFIDLSKSWVARFNRTQTEGQSYDVSNVSGSSLIITGFKKNAFNYSNRGQTFYFKIHFSIKVEYTATAVTLKFTVEDIYTDSDVLAKSKIPDYYTSEGKLKEGYDGLDTSLQTTVNNILYDYYDYIVNYQ